MKARELRIGNLVEYPNWHENQDKCIFKIRDIYTDDNKIGLTNGIIQIPSTKLNYIKPIPLTEEWLLKFGFQKIHNGSFMINFQGRTYYFDLVNNSLFAKHIRLNQYDIEYIHQLQNLYFALTGEELTIKQS